MKKILKVLLVVVLCFGIVGCSNNDSKDNDNNNSNQDDVTETALEKLEKVMTVKIEVTESGSVYVYATIGDDEARFIYYRQLEGDDKTIAEALGIKEDTLAFENYIYSYHIDSEIQLYAYEELSNEDIESEIETLLSGYDLTVDEVKEALKSA